MSLCCKKCGGIEQVKNGKMRDLQRYRCKTCGYNFVEGDGRRAKGGAPLKAGERKD